MKQNKMLDTLCQAWQKGSALAAKTSGRVAVNKHYLYRSIYHVSTTHPVKNETFTCFSLLENNMCAQSSKSCLECICWDIVFVGSTLTPEAADFNDLDVNLRYLILECMHV